MVNIQFTLPFNTPTWNMLKFVLIELLVSGALSSTFVHFVRGRVGKLRERDQTVRLAEFGLGRFTPYNLIWFKTSSDSSTSTKRGRRHIHVFFSIIFLNLLVLGLLLLAEFGSDSETVRDVVISQGFGAKSAQKLAAAEVSIEDYSNATLFQPQPTCFSKSMLETSIAPFSTKSASCADTSNLDSAAKFKACAPRGSHPGITECSDTSVSEALGFSGSRIDVSSQHFGISVVGSQTITAKQTALLGTDEPGGFYKLVEGKLRLVAEDERSPDGSGVWTGQSDTVCLLSSKAAGAYSRPGLGQTDNNWVVRSCFVHSSRESRVFAFGVDHRAGGRGGNTNGNVQEIESFVISKYAYLRLESESVATRPHIGVLMALAGQCKISYSLNKAPIALQHNVIEAFARNNLFRLLGLVSGLGEYQVPIQSGEGIERATINLMFVVPVLIFLFVGLVQIILALILRNDQEVIADLGSAIKECDMYEANCNDEKWLRTRLEEITTLRHV